MRSARQRRADPAVGGALLAERRRRTAAEEQQLGPNEADAVGAGSGRGLRLARRADVRRDRDAGVRTSDGRSATGRGRSSGSKRRR